MVGSREQSVERKARASAARGVAAAAGLAGMLLFGAMPAHADKAAADRCAGKLPAEARSIYSASAPLLVQGVDGRMIVTEQTRKLVLAGKVSHLTASQSAEAAASCLVLR